jgi:lipopolysaccharide export system permease protein
VAMSRHRIHRYLLRETVVPMLLGLAIFTLVLLMGRLLKLMELVITKGVPVPDILYLFACLLPTFLVITLPLSFLLGVMMAFGRLSSDREILAMKASGISLRQLAVPILVFGLATSLMTAALTLVVKPASETAFRTQLFHITTSRPSIGIQAQVFNDEFEGLVLYTDRLEEHSGIMEGVFVYDEQQKPPVFILARRGRVLSDPKALTLTLRLENGSIHRQPRQGPQENFQVISFSSYDLNLDLGRQAQNDMPTRKNRKEMSLAELRQDMNRAGNAARLNKLRGEYHWRMTLPGAPLLFALLGVPLGIQPLRSGRGGGFAIGLVVFLVYYALLSLTHTLVVESGLPGMVMWLPNVLFLLGGLILLQAANREVPPPLAASIGRLAALWKRGTRKTET